MVNLSRGRPTSVALLLLLAMSLAVAAVALTTQAKPAYAGTCGVHRVYDYVCNEKDNPFPPQTYCDEPGQFTIGWYRARIEQRASPWTKMRTARWQVLACTYNGAYPSFNCPRTCN